MSCSTAGGRCPGGHGLAVCFAAAAIRRQRLLACSMRLPLHMVPHSMYSAKGLLLSHPCPLQRCKRPAHPAAQLSPRQAASQLRCRAAWLAWRNSGSPQQHSSQRAALPAARPKLSRSRLPRSHYRVQHAIQCRQCTVESGYACGRRGCTLGRGPTGEAQGAGAGAGAAASGSRPGERCA